MFCLFAGLAFTPQLTLLQKVRGLMETLRQIQQFSVLFASGVNKKAYDHAFLFGEIMKELNFSL